MRRYALAFLLMLSFALPQAAHADSFLYTIVWNYTPPNPIVDLSSFKGTYTFTTDHLLLGTTFVARPEGPSHNFPTYTYYYADDITAPEGSNVAEIQIDYHPNYVSPFGSPQKTLYGVGLYGAGSGPASVTTLLQDPLNPYSFIADYSNGNRTNYMSLDITPLSTPPAVPEPSTLLLIGTGAIVATGRLRRFRS